MLDSYIEFGAVDVLPDQLVASLTEFTREFDRNPHIAKRRPLAGPNDIFDFVMSAEYWEALAPWAEEILKGAAGYIGGYLTSTVLKSRAERSLNKQIDALETRVERQAGERQKMVEEKFDQIIELLTETQTSWASHFELRIGLKGGLDDADRASIVFEINPEANAPRDILQERPANEIKREEIAKAVMACGVLGPAIEAYMKDYRDQHGSDVRFGGRFFVSENETFVAEVCTSQDGQPIPYGKSKVRFEQHQDHTLEISTVESEI